MKDSPLIVKVAHNEFKANKDLLWKYTIPEEVILESGDYVFGKEGEFAVEKKKLMDFWNSYTSHRLHRQILDMKKTYKMCCLLIEGKYIPTKTMVSRCIKQGKTPQQARKIVQGKIMSIYHTINSLSFLIPIVWTGSKSESLREMIRLYRKYERGELGTLDRGVEVHKVDTDDVHNMLVGIKGVGRGLAVFIKNNFRDLLDFVKNVHKLPDMKMGKRNIGKNADSIVELVKRKW